MLLDAVRAVASGSTYLDPSIAGKVVAGFAREHAKPGTAPIEKLSDREREVLRQIAWATRTRRSPRGWS